MRTVGIIPVESLPEFEAGADLGQAIVDAVGATEFVEGDVIVVAQKIVSKAEGRLIPEEERAVAIEAESRRILRRSGDLVISETLHGFVCANAGVDRSNAPDGTALLLPVDPDASARSIRSQIQHLTGLTVAVVVSDTFGRAWRRGQTNIAIGVAGLRPFIDHRGTSDPLGRELQATEICVADELAGAAEMVMGKTYGIGAAIVRGVRYQPGRGAATEIVRPPAEDLFR